MTITRLMPITACKTRSIGLLVIASALISPQYGCVTVPNNLRYNLPPSGTPLASLVNGSLKGGGRIAMIDGKEPAAFASSIPISVGLHSVMIDCGKAETKSLMVLPVIPFVVPVVKSTVGHATLTGNFEEGRTYYARCIFIGDEAQLWFADSREGPPLSNFQ